MHYVYIIQSSRNDSFYIGHSTDLKKRLDNHNSGSVKATASQVPYRIRWYCTFSQKEKAIEFEKYLKKGSGYAFMKKRLI